VILSKICSRVSKITRRCRLGEIDGADIPGDTARQPRANLPGKPRLADPARPGERDKPIGDQTVADQNQGVVAPDEGR